MTDAPSVSIDRIRLESIEHRRQTCNHVIRTRKRKLAELYCISRSPLIPISEDQVLHIEDRLMAFLEKNDLENGHEFDLGTLTEKQSPPAQQQPKQQALTVPPAQKSQTPQPQSQQEQQPLQEEKIVDSEEPPQKTARTSGDLSVSLQKVDSKEDSESTRPESIVITERHEESWSDEEPTLSSLIRKRPDKEALKRTDTRTDRDLNVTEVEMNDLLVLLMPEKYPHKIPEATSLTELYYHSQTLPIINLILRAHKSLSTDAYETALLEGKLAVLYSRIEELKRQKKWSLRQPKKYVDPFQGSQAHWDHMLDEMKWLATDFKEERKYKLVQCYQISQAVMDYWNYGKIMCVKRKPIKHLDPPELQDVDMDTAEEVTQQEDSIDVSLLLQRPDPSQEIVPKELPAYTEEEAKKLLTEEGELPFKLYANMEQLNGVSASLLDKMPLFEPLNEPAVLPDTYETMHIDPISSLITPMDEDEEEWYKLIYKKQEEHERAHVEYQKGLFGIATHRRFPLLRPPPPPSLKNLELRIPTIWLPQDDKPLIRYVTEYSFNWGVIAAHLSPKPTRSYTSNIERRTPWQCFERYIQLNDKFQFSDMRGIYAAAAKEWLEAAHKAQTTTKRRISPLGVGPESIQRGHRRLRWGSMFDAIRKLMKKRENTPKPNNQVKRTSSDEKRLDTPTPAALSRLKYERDKAIQEAYMHQSTGNGSFPRPRASGTPVGGAPASGSGTPVPSRPQAGVPIAKAEPEAGSASQRGTPIARAPGAATPVPANAAAAAAAMAKRRMNGQGGPLTGPNGVPYTNEQLQQLMQLQKQRQLLQKSAETTPPPASASSGTSSTGSSSQANAGRPVQAKGDGRLLSFSAQQVSAIINQIQAQNPKMSKEQVTKLAAAYIANRQAQAKLKATAGEVKREDTPGATTLNTANLTPQQRTQLALARSAQLQRRQMMLQQQQSQASSPAASRPVSQGVSPTSQGAPSQASSTSATPAAQSPVNSSGGTRTRSTQNPDQ